METSLPDIFESLQVQLGWPGFSLEESFADQSLATEEASLAFAFTDIPRLLLLFLLGYMVSWTLSPGQCALDNGHWPIMSLYMSTKACNDSLQGMYYCQ